MIYLNEGANMVPVTLRDRIKLASPNILVKLEYTQASSHTKILLAIDSSQTSDRVSLLGIELVTNPNDEDLPNGKVYLQSGNHHYTIYESDTTALDIDGKCELTRGILRYDVDHSDGDDYERDITEIVY